MFVGIAALSPYFRGRRIAVPTNAGRCAAGCWCTSTTAWWRCSLGHSALARPEGRVSEGAQEPQVRLHVRHCHERRWRVLHGVPHLGRRGIRARGSWGWGSRGSPPRGMAFSRHQAALYEQHKKWMIRSYVVTFAFVTFRALSSGLEGQRRRHSSTVSALPPGSAGQFCCLLNELILQGRPELARAGGLTRLVGRVGREGGEGREGREGRVAPSALCRLLRFLCRASTTSAPFLRAVATRVGGRAARPRRRRS